MRSCRRLPISDIVREKGGGSGGRHWAPVPGRLSLSRRNQVRFRIAIRPPNATGAFQSWSRSYARGKNGSPEVEQPPINKKEEFSWKPGDRIQIEWLWSSHWGPNDTTIGKKTFSDPWTSLLDILGGVDLKPKTGAGHARLDGNTPKATIVCDEFPEPKNDLRLFRKYIVPGTYWQD